MTSRAMSVKREIDLKAAAEDQPIRQRWALKIQTQSTQRTQRGIQPLLIPLNWFFSIMSSFFVSFENLFRSLGASKRWRSYLPIQRP
jgi:hypothetical protein